MKFKYAPGLPGYGTKGIDGSAGLAGLGLYFTSYDGKSDGITLSTKIALNKILYSTDAFISGYPERTYQVGDSFLDKNGNAFSITNPTTGAYSLISNSALNISGLFSFVKTSKSFSRYVNDYNIQRILIDDVITTSSVTDYTTYPANIYGFGASNFGKIHYSDYTESESVYNPFIIWTAGEEDAHSIALVRDYNTNDFRFGNLDNNGNVRNVNIIFDASNVMVSKDTGTEFTRYQEDGLVLTNHEMNANLLFTPVFSIDGVDVDQTSLTMVAGGGTNDVSIYWNLYNFFKDSDITLLNSIKTNLYIYESSTGNWDGLTISANDVSKYSPLVLHNLDASGKIHVTDLKTSTRYESYIEFFNNGWLRKSNIRVTETGGSGIDPSIVTSPFSFSSISPDGSILTGYVSIIGADWTASSSKSWIHVSPASGGEGQNQVLDISVGPNTGSSRFGNVSVFSSAGNRNIGIYQNAAAASTYTIFFTLSATFAPGFDQIEGTLVLKDSGGNPVDGQSKGVNENSESSWDYNFYNVPAGISYYVDMIGVRAHYLGTAIVTSWGWSDDGVTYTGDSQTDTFVLNSNISRFGEITGGAF